MALISRGFRGRDRSGDVALPPGQYLTSDFPVLSAGPTPRISQDRWRLSGLHSRRELSRRGTG